MGWKGKICNPQEVGAEGQGRLQRVLCCRDWGTGSGETKSNAASKFILQLFYSLDLASENTSKKNILFSWVLVMFLFIKLVLSSK